VDLGRKRNRADLIEVFKMIKSLSATPWSSFFHIAAAVPLEVTAGNLQRSLAGVIQDCTSFLRKLWIDGIGYLRQKLIHRQ